mgnify:CR=1 FL=1
MRRKLQCDCLNSIFTGVPCYHMFAIVIKEEIPSESLPFNRRWELEYFTEVKKDKDFSEILIKEDKENERIPIKLSDKKVYIYKY